MIKPSQLLFFLCMLVSLSGFSQTWEIGATAGGMGYMGDLNQNKFYKITNGAVGGMVKRNFDGYWSLKLAFLSGGVKGNDAESVHEQERNRNLSFNSPITEASLQVEFNFFDYGVDLGQKRISPYLFTGISYFGFNPKTTLNNKEYELKNYGTEGQGDSPAYKTLASAIPFGAGLKFRISEYLNLAGEIGYRKANTDYLDDVSQKYFNHTDPEKQALGDPSILKIGTPGTQRGDFRKKDTYMFVGITLSYTFVRQNCPL